MPAPKPCAAAAGLLLAACLVSLDGDFHLAFGFAALLPAFSSAPPLIQRASKSISASAACPLLRHERLSFVRHKREQIAAFRVARLDRRSRCAALHQVQVIRDVQIGLVRGRVVTRPAALAENGRHVVVIGDFIVASQLCTASAACSDGYSSRCR